jgi:hypothetical protein
VVEDFGLLIRGYSVVLDVLAVDCKSAHAGGAGTGFRARVGPVGGRTSRYRCEPQPRRADLKRFLVPLFVVAALVAGVATSVGAKPPGDTRDNDVGKMIYKFNVLAVPQEWSQDDSECSNSGRRVFFERDGSGPIGTIEWDLWPSVNNFTMLDCDGTSDTTAVVEGPEGVEFYVMIRLHGPPTDSLSLTCTDVIDEGVDDLCLVGTVQGQRGGFTKIMENVFDNAYEEVLWTLETSTNFRNAEVRVYEKL